MENFLTSVSILPLLLIFSFILKKTGVLKKEWAQPLNFIGFNIGLASLIFLAFLRTPVAKNALLNPVLGFMFALCLFVIGLILVKILKISGEKRAIFVSSLVTLEGGAIGYPFFMAIFGQENLPYITLLDLGMAFFAFTVLTFYFYKNAHITGKKISALLIEIFRIPIFLAMFAGLALNLAGLNLESGGLVGTIILRFLENIGAIAVPLILISLVLRLEINLASIKKTLLFSFGSIGITVALALLWFSAWKIIPLPQITKGALLIMAFLPPSIYPFSLTEKLNLSEESKNYASHLFSVTVFMSIILLLAFSPLIIKLLR